MGYIKDLTALSKTTKKLIDTASINYKNGKINHLDAC